jgi:hypothetical protein
VIRSHLHHDSRTPTAFFLPVDPWSSAASGVSAPEIVFDLEEAVIVVEKNCFSNPSPLLSCGSRRKSQRISGLYPADLLTPLIAVALFSSAAACKEGHSGP